MPARSAPENRSSSANFSMPARAATSSASVAATSRISPGRARPAFGRPIDAHRRVFERRAKGDGAVAGQGPRRRRPDQRRGPFERGPGGTADRETHPDRRRTMIVVLDLGLGERGLLDHRPQHRLRALVEPAIHQELADLAHDLRLGGIGHRRIGVVPVADHAEPLEVALLHLDPMRGEIAAFAAEAVDRDAVFRLAPGAVLFLDEPFDRQPVAIPARHIGRVPAQHLLRAVDDVLQDLVERGAEMDFAIGIRRAVMQHEFLAAPRRLAQLAGKAPSPPSAPASPARASAGRRASGTGSWAEIRSDDNPSASQNLGSGDESESVPDPQSRTGPVIRRIQPPLVAIAEI